MSRSSVVLLCSFLALPLGQAAAQARDSAGPVLRAAVVENGPVELDGRLDEPAWAQAEVASGFTQSYPDPGAPATLKTEARVLFTADALLVGVRAYDPHPDSIAAQLARRDAIGIYSDWIHVYVDSYLDRRTGFTFSVNPRGVKRDILFSSDVNEDRGWDAVWDAATRVDSLGWVAEFRIPFSQLRFGTSASGAERSWGFQVQRDVARHQERVSWSPWTRESPGFVSRFGTLTGLVGIGTPRQLEILPYVSSRLTRAPRQAGNPFFSPNEVSASMGADVKYGLPAGLTLTATLNPDFGQVEVDPAVVNLTAFETFFPEKRPFFSEGADIFRFGGVSRYVNWQFEQFFYTRRIGRSPQRVLGGGGIRFVDAPEQTTILGAGKVSGKLGPWTVGVLSALTAEEEARLLPATGGTVTSAVEPLTHYLVGRTERDFRSGNTVVGGMLTAANRDAQDTVFSPLLHSGAYLGGVDFRHSWARQVWTISGYVARSQVEGSRRAVGLTQLSSARYFQRPDADYLELDSTRTDLGGYMAKIALVRNGSWFGTLDYKEASPGFAMNDVGFQERTDYRNLNFFVGRRVTAPRGIFRNYMAFTAGLLAWNFGGTQISNLYITGLQGLLSNQWSPSVNLEFNAGSQDDRLTRGGPLSETPRSGALTLSLQSDPRQRFSYGTLGRYQRDASGAVTRTASLSLGYRPSPSLRLRLEPSLSSAHVTGQYVRTVVDPLAQETFGRRYLFADVDRTTASLETRLDWTFSPTLSLELFAQPFVASGDFRNYKEFLTPGEFDFAVYGQDRGTIAKGGGCTDPTGAGNLLAIDPDDQGPARCFTVPDRDFNLRSLRGNAVMRWEFRPGSTLFLVWQQRRQGQEAIGTFDLGRDAGELFRVPPVNVFLIKMTYWLAR